MAELLTAHAVLVGCLYGAAASVLFTVMPAIKRNVYVQIFYVTGFFGAILNVGAGAGLLGGGPLGAFATVIVLVFKGVIVLLFNAIPLYAAFDSFLDAIQRNLSGDDMITRRRSYDRAEGAEARGELERAEQLYREYLAEDSSDPEGHRKLAELLLTMGRTGDALQEMETALKVCDEPEQERATLWRLGELHEENGNHEAAARYFRRLVRRHPDGRRAPYARKRLERLSPEDTETT